MPEAIIIRPFTEDDAGPVRSLFIAVNRLLAPPHMADKFEKYIDQSLTDEIDKIPDYYARKHGDFWVAIEDGKLVGMFGLELSSATTMELRRMYVAPEARRRGIARLMLQFVESECLRRKIPQIDLSTSELQGDALSLYKASGYLLVREEVSNIASNKTLGGGLRRYHYTKAL